MVEIERGCGWRFVGGVYLACDGIRACCDGLPVELAPCPCCEFTVNQARSMQPIHAGYLASLMKGHVCNEEFANCPICYYGTQYATQRAELTVARADLAKGWTEDKAEKVADLEKAIPKVFYLMFVSKEFYTPESFLKEANEQGVSKRIAPNSLPKGFVVGKDWVFLAHNEQRFYPKGEDGADLVKSEPRVATGIFYAFKPERLELVLWKGTDPQLIADYEEAGYTVVLIDKTPENQQRHGEVPLPPLPYGFKRKDKSKLPAKTFANRGSRHRGLYNEGGKGKAKATVVKGAPAPKTRAKRGSDKMEADVEADGEPHEDSHWGKGEL